MRHTLSLSLLDLVLCPGCYALHVLVPILVIYIYLCNTMIVVCGSILFTFSSHLANLRGVGRVLRAG